MKFIPLEIVDDGTVPERPDGSGPWMFDGFEPDVELTYSRNPNWHTEGLPYFDNLQLSMIGDASTILANLEGGEFDASLLDFTVYGTAVEQIPSWNSPSTAITSSAASITTTPPSPSTTLVSGKR